MKKEIKKKMFLLILFLPFSVFSSTYYYNGVPVDTGNQDIIINNNTTIIINKNHSYKNNTQLKNNNFNSGEKQLPNKGIVRSGTPYLSGNGHVLNNNADQNINIQTTK